MVSAWVSKGFEIRIGLNRLKHLRFSNGLKNYDFQVRWRIQSFKSSQKIKGSNGLNLLRFSFGLWGLNGLSVWTESELLRIAYAFGFGFWFFLINWVFFLTKVFFSFKRILFVCFFCLEGCWVFFEENHLSSKIALIICFLKWSIFWLY